MLLLTALFCMGVAVTLVNVYHFSSNLVLNQAVTTAELYAKAIREARSVYSSEVIDRIKTIDGLTATHNYHVMDNAIPIPATFLMTLGWSISEKSGEMALKFYSDYPFPGGQAAMRGTKKDRFDREALLWLRQYPNQPFYRIEIMNEQRYLRYAQADIMQPTCVACHNSHPDSPKTDWKVGDVRGVLEIILPLEEFIQQTRQGLQGTFLTLSGVFVLAIIGLTIIISRLRNISHELEKRVRERTAKLAEANTKVEEERHKSERLLLNILPYSIAERLKQGHNPIADWFPQVTILFADIVGFTQLSSQISAPELVDRLNDIFTAFDYWTEYYSLEKIKTIGDNYMVVGGVPKEHPNHANAIAEMALQIKEEIVKFNRDRQQNLNIRIGINTGPVVAGVIGQQKFIYDLWGDAVNTASRMESHSLPGQIQVTEVTYRLLNDRYQFEKRGDIEIKGKGKMTTYFLQGRKENSTP
ncbi:adenylate/guanylate cyclase domain-containing protein [Roseofilum sp. BLCC_M143]|uniref:guanylate cyclase n=1 Tax=Roseofilum casamattae BLCC-M143 TaxID=3022442 RepID=A0ABT7BT69_9CYAN|nr:adenylate/guanylate cyclase domain-containing protein [Roseofilum casamattae BLCC-M143]